MKVELEHRYGWETYDVDAPDLASAAKAAIRQSHHFLTDDNHWMQEDGAVIVVIRAADAEPPAITPWWARESFKAGGHWFAVGFREPR